MRCWLPYDWQKSTSSLKMTYCSIFCEKAHLGFTMESIERHFARTISIDYSEFTKRLGEETPQGAPPAPTPAHEPQGDDYLGDGAWWYV